MGNKKYSLIKGTNVEVDSSNITGKLIKVNGIINQKTREQVNGTTIKSENINVNDVTVETGRLDFFGNLKQETRSGKNKFISLGNNTIAGITITENEDGTYNFSGTAAANIEHTAFINVEKSDIKNGSTYILSSTKTLPTGLSSRVERYTDSAWLGQFVTSITSTIPTRTGVADTTDTTRFRFGIFISSGTTLNIQNIGFQLEEGTVATEYEQYGVSPSPDYPGEIKVVGDNVNLLNKNTVTKGKYISNGTISTNANYCYSDYIEVIPNEKYVWNTSDGSIGTFICFYDKDKTYISGTSSVKNISVKTPENCKYVIISFDMRFLDNAKLEKGTVATGYTSYGIGGIDYKTVGKNLIGVNDSSSSTNLGITVEYDNSTGIYTLNGTSTNAGYIKLYDDLEVLTYTNLNTKNRTMICKGEYTLSYKYISGTKTDGTANVMIRDCNDSVDLPRYEIAKFGTENKQIQFTVAEDYLTQKYIWFASGITFTDLKFTIQLEIGINVTEHEPYYEEKRVIELQEGEFLAKLGNYEDSIDNSGLLKKWIKKSEGSELGWRLGGTQNFEDSLIFYSITKDAKFDNNVNNNIKSTHFKSENPYNNNIEAVGIMSTGEIGIRIKTTIASTLEEFTTWLDENGVEIYYVLAKYTTVELSEASQIKMNYLAKLPMYLPITNVYSEDTISPFFRLRYNYVPALPNPDEFSPISVVGDNINLFNLNSVEIGSNCTYNINDNSIVVKATGTNAYVKSKTYNLSAGSYNLSGSATSDDYKGVAIYVNGSYFDSVASSNLEKIFTLTEDSEVVFRFYASSSSSSTSATAIYSNIKIEKGTIATGYTSYGNGGFDYKAIGKNLFNFKAFFENCLTTRCTKTLLENGIKIDFTAGADAWIGNTINANISIHPYEKAGCIKVKPNTRYVMQMSSAPKCFISFLDKNYIAVRSFITIPNTYKKSTYAFYTTSDTHYLYFRFGITDSNYTSYSFTDIQLAQEMTVSDYEPYKEQISTIELPNGEFMAKIGDVQDYIDNTGVLHKYIKKIILTGEEAWATNMNAGWTENKHVFGITNYEIETNGQSTDTGIVLASSHYKATNTSVLVFSKNDCISYYPANSRIVINHRNINNVTDFKAWLAEQYAAGTPVEVYYITNEPYTVDLSDEDYTKIQSVPMLIDYNNISLEPENNEFVLVYEGDEIEKSYDVTITDSGKLQPFGLTIDYNKTNLPLIAEADEASQIITGADGDVVLNTTYGPRMFEITAVTDDYLTAEEKEAKREEIREFLNAIKNKTAKLIIEPLNRTFEVKYSGVAEDNNLPKCVEFVIPLKSSNSYAISNETYSHIGSGDFDSDTVEPAGCKITITGPANVPNININGYDVIWNHILAEGQKLIIDSKKSTVTRVSSLGVKTNVMAYYSHQFPKIQKGVNFVEIISGIEDSQLKIEWNDLLL